MIVVSSQNGFPIVKTIATLSDEHRLTCSMDVAARLNIAEEIIGCLSFEDAIAMVKTRQASAAMVPAAYPRVGYFIMDRDLRCVDAIVCQISPIVFSSLREEPAQFIEAIYLHQALEPLLAEVDAPYGRLRITGSKPESARLASRHGSSAACLTNIPSAKHYGLTVHKVLRAGISMPWLIFQRTLECNSDSQ